MAKTRANGKAKAVEPVAAKKHQARSNDKVTKANGNAKAVKSGAAKKRKANSNDTTVTAVRATSTPSDDDIVMIEVDEIFKAAGLVQQAKHKAEEDKCRTEMMAAQALQALEAIPAVEGSKPFLDCLPIETIQNIGDFLDDGSDNGDKDLGNLAMTCRQTYNAIGHCEFGIWIKRFSKRFELLPGYTKPELITEYKERQIIIRKGNKVATGRNKREMKVVNLLKKLILESFRSKAKGNGKPYSQNLDKIWEVAQKSQILDIIHRYILTDTTTNAHNGMEYFSVTVADVQVVQLVLAHMFLRPLSPQPFGIEYTQMAVYGHPHDYPMFVRRKLNLEFLLFILNFFQYHLSDKNQGTLQHLVKTLDLGSPKAWDKKLKNGLRKLGKKWNGASASMDDPFTVFPMIRSCAPGYTIDLFPDTITAAKFEFDFEKPLPVWPDIFQENLLSIPTRITEQGPCQKGKDYLQFSSCDKKDPHDIVTGILHALPYQHGIPGFQRATWMTVPPSHRYEDEKELMEDAANQIAVMDITGDITAYEGIVLPGAKIMVGRWWSPNDTPEEELEGGLNGYYKQERCEIGPFILWAVDEEEEEA
ncbi:hypothetical protein MMC30_005646 [Trapelia coarctata]|nr:hypothetical protein [Trapelia coarctata]